MFKKDNKTRNIFIIALIALIAIVYSSCNSSDDESKDNSSNSDSDLSFVETIDLATNSSNGNFNILNTSAENFVISDNKEFFDANFIKKIHSGTTSVMINISNLGGVKRFFAIKESTLEEYENKKDVPIPESEILTSIDYDSQHGGTWNPFGSPSPTIKKGAIFINNYTDSIIFVIPQNEYNSPEGRVNRGQKNVKVPFITGTNYVYFVDVSTGNLIDSKEIFVSDQSTPYVDVGKPDNLPVDPAILKINNNTNKIYSVINMMTDQYLINNDCNCTDIGPNTIGEFEVIPNTLQLKLIANDNSTITSDVMNVSEGQIVYLTVQNNSISTNK